MKKQKHVFVNLNFKEGEFGDDELGDAAGGRKCGTMYTIDGHPIVTIFNTCEYWKDKHTYEEIPEGGNCPECLHCHSFNWGDKCRAWQRYEN